MNDDERRKIQAIGTLFAAFPRGELTDEVLTIYRRFLSRVPAEAVEAAVLQIISVRVYPDPPSVAEVLKGCRKAVAEAHDLAQKRIEERRRHTVEMADPEQLRRFASVMEKEGRAKRSVVYSAIASILRQGAKAAEQRAQVGPGETRRRLGQGGDDGGGA